MEPSREVVVTGVGVVSPIGIGRDAFWTSLIEGRSGVRRIARFDASGTPVDFGGEVTDFDGRRYIRPVKALKVMSREIQLGATAALLAAADARLADSGVDPDRVGVVFGTDLIQCDPEEVTAAFRRCLVDGQFHFDRWGTAALEEIHPLWLLRHLPNMPACHIAIAHDARGPNNSITLGEVSSLLAVAEAVRTIERGQADVMFAGGTGTRVHPTLWVRSFLSPLSKRIDRPQAASRPFDLDRDGMVNGEGAAAVILESRAAAEARGAPTLATVSGYACRHESTRQANCSGQALRQSLRAVLAEARWSPRDVGHVNADGRSTIDDDRDEAAAIHQVLGDVPVTAPKSYFGHLGAGSGAVELVASVLALQHGQVPPTLNYERADPACPVRVVQGAPLAGCPAAAIVVNRSPMGQAAALALRSG